ncbi:MAG: TetR/AcrR family transcriptional regulator [Candidatus Delongbacteria bacterium]|jgi:AcrR family transcriptional regulator|nr:TetR/AcrR family transcriptional regulator [Candidatus Delongbacteria bacterium]
MATVLQKKRKKQILEAASEIFAKEGLFGAEQDSIAKAAEVGKGTLYRYFENKNDLYINTIEFQAEKSFRYIDSHINKSENLDDLLINFIEATVDYFLKNPITFDIIVRSNNTMLFEAVGVVQKVRDKYLSKYYLYFDKAIEEGAVKTFNKNIILTMLDTCIVSLVYEHKSNSKYSVREIKDTLISIFRTGIKK